MCFANEWKTRGEEKDSLGVRVCLRVCGGVLSVDNKGPCVQIGETIFR